MADNWIIKRFSRVKRVLLCALSRFVIFNVPLPAHIAGLVAWMSGLLTLSEAKEAGQ